MIARILPPTAEAISSATRLLREGQVVGMPTETVYGLAGSAFDEKALTRIFSVKERPTFDPLIVHVSPEMLGQNPAKSHESTPTEDCGRPMLAGTPLLNSLATLGLMDLSRLSVLAQSRSEALLQAFWPGPFTLVLPKSGKVPDLVTSGLGTVAIRMPRHPVAQKLITEAGVPLAAPSANRFGRISPTSAQDVQEELGDRIPMILDGGRCEVGLESTVVAVSEEGELTLLRPGAITAAQIETVVARAISKGSPSPVDRLPRLASPGMLASHYAPTKPLILLPAPLDHLTPPQRAEIATMPSLPNQLGLLVQAGSAQRAQETFSQLTAKKVTVLSLSEGGDLEEAARHFFTMLRALDNSKAELLFAEPCLIREGLGHAIQDRLARASHRN